MRTIQGDHPELAGECRRRLLEPPHQRGQWFRSKKTRDGECNGEKQQLNPPSRVHASKGGQFGRRIFITKDF
jgi:hypothetical protein